MALDKNNKFIIFSCGFNCEKYVEKHIKSIKNQTYKNYIHILVDDASIDRTYSELMKHKDSKVIVYRNTKNKKWLANSVKYLDNFVLRDSYVIVIVDMDDWLAHNRVLEKLNTVFIQICWLVHSECQFFNGKTYGRKIGKKATGKFRSTWTFGHLQAFRVFLWRSIDRNDFKQNGVYFSYAYDKAIMYPMLEMATSKHTSFIPEVLYIYNRANPYNVDKLNKKRQLICDKLIRKKPVYKPLVRSI